MREDDRGAPLVIAPARDVDLPAIDAYLAARSDTCMLLRSNLRAAGLAWSPPDGVVPEGHYTIARRTGAVIGVVGHAWSGTVLVQADAYAGQLAAAAVRHSGRRVTGLLGASEQVTEAQEALGLGATPPKLDSREILMALPLDRLAVPSALSSGALVGRRAVAGDREQLIPWRAAYHVETGQRSPGPDADPRAADAIDGALGSGRLWVVERNGAVVAMCTHNAEVPDAVQIGGVFTPPALRARGHARAVVAASLVDARTRGVARAILFTPRPDAVAAYRAIGFEPIGQFAIVLYA